MKGERIRRGGIYKRRLREVTVGRVQSRGPEIGHANTSAAGHLGVRLGGQSAVMGPQQQQSTESRPYLQTFEPTESKDLLNLGRYTRERNRRSSWYGGLHRKS